MGPGDKRCRFAGGINESGELTCCHVWSEGEFCCAMPDIAFARARDIGSNPDAWCAGENTERLKARCESFWDAPIEVSVDEYGPKILQR